MRGCRLTDIGWEGQCDQCRQWWPLDRDSWRPKEGMRTCLACIREARAVYLRRLRDANPEMRARHREASRDNQHVKRAVDRQAYLEYQRRWWAKHHVRLSAEAAERHVIKLELAGLRPTRRSPRDETDETLAFRAAFRARWVARFGPIGREPSDALERQRAYKRDWQRRWRARQRAA